MREASTALTLVVVLLVVLGTTQWAQAQTFTVLHAFSGGDDGANPYGGPILDKMGILYGTTETLGSHGYGTAFKLEPGDTLTVLHGFAGGTDGANPFVGLLRDGAGNLYGVTTSAGNTKCNPPYGCGLVFKLEKSGRKTVLHSFAGGTTDGCYPYSALIEDKSGNLWHDFGLRRLWTRNRVPPEQGRQRNRVAQFRWGSVGWQRPFLCKSAHGRDGQPLRRDRVRRQHRMFRNRMWSSLQAE